MGRFTPLLGRQEGQVGEEAASSENVVRRSRYVEVAVLVAIAILGFLVGQAIVYIGVEDTQRWRLLEGFYGFHIWAALASGQVAYWAVASTLLFRQAARLSVEFQIKWRRVAVPVVSATVAIAAAIMIPTSLLATRSHDGDLWPASTQRLLVMYVIGLVAVMAGLLNSAIIERSVSDPSRYQGRVAIIIDQYRRFDAAHRTTLYVLGLAVSLIVLTTGAQIRMRESFNETQVSPPVPVPSQTTLLVYGALFVIVLLIIYLPAALSIREFGSSAIRFAIPHDESNEHNASQASPSEKESKILADLEREADMRSKLGLDSSTMETLQKSVVVLSPLLTSAVSLLVGGGV